MSDLSPSLANEASGLEPSIGGNVSLYADIPTEELVERLGREFELYGKLDEALPSRMSSRTKRKDLEQLSICIDICEELKSRPARESFRVKRLLSHPHPVVAIKVSEYFIDSLTEEDANYLIEINRRPFDENNIPDRFAAMAYGLLKSLSGRGIIKNWVPPW